MVWGQTALSWLKQKGVMLKCRILDGDWMSTWKMSYWSLACMSMIFQLPSERCYRKPQDCMKSPRTWVKWVWRGKTKESRCGGRGQQVRGRGTLTPSQGQGSHWCLFPQMIFTTCRCLNKNIISTPSDLLFSSEIFFLIKGGHKGWAVNQASKAVYHLS